MANACTSVSRSRILQGEGNVDVWFSLEQFYRDHTQEVLDKLSSLDDGIWGKLILMEKNRRIAKAYLRAPSVQVNGSTVGFEGNTIGYNSFSSPTNDPYAAEIRSKISSGVVVKIDRHGNLLAKRRGRSPVIVQGAVSAFDTQPITAETAPLDGRLEMQRVFKIFDMKAYKQAVERELSSPSPNVEKVLYGSAVRISLVKDLAHPLKTPCWLLLINVVAMDVLLSRLDILQIPLPVAKKKSKDASSYVRSISSAQPSTSKKMFMTTLQRPRSEMELNSVSDHSPSGESGLECEDEEERRPKSSKWRSTTALFCVPEIAEPKRRFGQNALLGKLKPQFWQSNFKGDPSFYESSISSSHSMSQSPSYSPSVLSDSCSETPTTDSGFLETRFDSDGQRVSVENGTKPRPKAKLPYRNANEIRKMSKSCVEICHL